MLSGHRLINGLLSCYFMLSFVTLGFMGALLFEGILYMGSVEAATIIVDSNGKGNYAKIQDAINAAQGGDTIHVWAGEYYERVVIDKKLTLIGNGTNKSIIDSGGSHNGIKITADNVTISGFLVAGGGLSGIKLNHVKNCNLNNNTLISNYHGIFLNYSNRNIIKDNIA